MSKERRLSRIFAKDGKSVTLALDGYYFSTKTNGIDNTINQLPALVEHGLDCALVTYGMLKNYREALNSVPVVLRVDSTVSIFDNTVPDTTPVFSVEDALKVAAEGVVCMTFPGAFNEEKTHIMAMQLAQAADRWNVPLIVESLPYGYPSPAMTLTIRPSSLHRPAQRWSWARTSSKRVLPVHQRTD